MSREEDKEFRKNQKVIRTNDTHVKKEKSTKLEKLETQYEREEDFLEGARYARDSAKKEGYEGYSIKDVADMNKRVKRIERGHNDSARRINEEKRRAKKTQTYTAKRGTMKKAKNKKNKGVKPKAKVTAILLAGMIGVGGVSLATTNVNANESITITQMQEEGETSENLGLSSSTIATFKRYDQLFEDFENGEYDYNDMSADTVVDMTEELESLTLSTIKEKMSSITGVDTSDIKINYKFNNGDGKYYVYIRTYEDSYKKESWNNANSSLFFKKKNNIPSKLANVITQLENLENLKSKIEEDVVDGKISYKKYLKQLQKYYENLEEVATSDFIMDENGNITLVQYENEQTNITAKTLTKQTGEERD